MAVTVAAETDGTHMNEIFEQVVGNPAIGAVGSAIGIAAVALWLAAAWWAHADALRRTESELAAYVAAGWIVISTPLLLPLSLLAYVCARPQESASDNRARALMQELATVSAAGASCPTCGTFAATGWLRCPTCATWLASPCGACGSWSDSALDICPWCGAESREEPVVAAPASALAPGALSRRRRTTPRGAGSIRPRGPQASARRGAYGPDGRLMAPARVRA